ncbi:plasma membrane calcium ATPase/chromosome segregation protein [Blumeria hordei DH14]|uniref:Plasma membrane calcium ATPase/chromosome segregation protein n=1 Tax=Blumeria graminis f. sp. hordei (strain DH14) TaxID=546991 RepID=N1J8R8_BLUG1|nr:plasma membrane calcium ATPase/chromosome segregation protein [Blumeria hordei DH14]
MPKPRRIRSTQTRSNDLQSESVDEEERESKRLKDSGKDSNLGRKVRERSKAPTTMAATRSSVMHTSSDQPPKEIKPQKSTRATSKRLVATEKRREPLQVSTEEADILGLQSIQTTEDNSIIVTKNVKTLNGSRKRLQTDSVPQNTINSSYPDDYKSVSRQVPRKRGRSKKETSSDEAAEKVIPETQQIQSDIGEEVEDDIDATKTNIDLNSNSQLSCSLTYQEANKKLRTKSPSESEDNTELISGQDFSQTSDKYQKLLRKYRELKETGIKEADKIFDAFKDHSKEKSKVTHDYISKLKDELATQAVLAEEMNNLRNKISSANEEISLLHEKNNQLEKSLAETQVENKILSTKLAANRNSALSGKNYSSNVPGSAIKVNGGTRIVGTAEAAQTAQLKEDMYSDLTGLLIRSVTRGADEDYFDCIQTGRNGSKFSILITSKWNFTHHIIALHFKLATGNEKSAESYEHIQCSYTPLLDPNRDKSLMELLPDYLVDEISFPRPHAAKFYARVVKVITEKPL